MNIPGFTAEASLYNSNVPYQSTTEATVYGGIVQPAGPFSDVFDPNRPVPGIFHPGWGNCLKYVCSFPEYYPGFPVRECRWVVAICQPIKIAELNVWSRV